MEQLAELTINTCDLSRGIELLAGRSSGELAHLIAVAPQLLLDEPDPCRRELMAALLDAARTILRVREAGPLHDDVYEPTENKYKEN